MELMSAVLLCAFATSLPQALGVYSLRQSEVIKLNGSLMLNQKSPNNRLLLNLNGPPLVHAITELQELFADIACSNCTRCIERAIKAKKKQFRSRPRPDELYYNVVNEYIPPQHKHSKRDVKFNNTEVRKGRSNSKTMVVTKYMNEDGKVYAVKVNESNTQTSNSTCEVYSVKKHLPCEAAESDLILAATKRKVNKKSRKLKDTTKSSTTRIPKSIMAAFKKREVRIENSHMPESFMPSIEELY